MEYKREAIKAAKQLFYPKEVIARLRKAKSEAEVERIMVSARKALPD